MDNKEVINSFINCFNNDGTDSEVVSLFTEKCCYWFSVILRERFKSSNAVSIMYDDNASHFGCSINGTVYDITGDVTNKYEWVPWCNTMDESNREMIIRCCIMLKD